MSTYLVALIVSDFESEFRQTDEIKFTVYARPNAINQTNYTLSVMSPLVKYFADTYKQKYPLSNLFVAAIPDFSSKAMENWGLLTYSETNILYDENHSPITSKHNIRNMIAHEISHQWFGNLISPAWWKYLWLSEGFATYFEYHATARVRNYVKHPNDIMPIYNYVIKIMFKSLITNFSILRRKFRNFLFYTTHTNPKIFYIVHTHCTSFCTLVYNEINLLFIF